MKTVKLTESELKNLIAECVKQRLNEGTTDRLAIAKWEYLSVNCGEQFLDSIINWLDCDTIDRILEYAEEDGYFEGTEFESGYGVDDSY